VQTFRHEPLIEVIRFLEVALTSQPTITFRVVNPRLANGLYSGEFLEVAGQRYCYRPLRVYLELAERLGCHCYILSVDDVYLVLHFEKRDERNAWHLHGKGNYGEGNYGEGKYSATSDYQRVQKLEEASFLFDYLEALERTKVRSGLRVLDLGVNTGEELLAFDLLGVSEVKVMGIDQEDSALALARQRFPHYTFIQADLNDLGTLELGRFDLILSISTLQSPGVADRELLRQLVQGYLNPGASLILAFSNSRYADGELLFGSRLKNFRQAELSLLVKDLAFYKKYLQQHGFQVFITGKYYL
jgi:SAM-dependent methyltransferase